MHYQQLGKTGIFVSRLCLGAMTFGGSAHPFWKVIGGLRQEAVDQMVALAIDKGVNFFDTADVYSAGESETMLGKALQSRRDDCVIATKLHNRMGPGCNQVGQSRVHIIKALEDSLQRLGTDYIDLYQIHSFDPLTCFEETLRTFDDLIRQGKVRYIGCSNLAAWQIMKALGVSALNKWESFVSVQAYYSAAGRDIEREIVPLVQDQKLGLLTWSPLAGGFLSGKFTKANAPADGSRRSQFSFPPVDSERAYAIIDVLQTIALRQGVSVAQVALAWQLHKPYVSSVIIGAKRIEQLEDNLHAVQVKLSAEEMSAIDSASQLAPEYPEWIHSMPSERLPGKTRDWSNFIIK